MELIFWCPNPTECNKEGLHSILLLMSHTTKKKAWMCLTCCASRIIGANYCHAGSHLCKWFCAESGPQSVSQSVSRTKLFLLKKIWSRLAEHTGEKVEHQVLFQSGAALIPFTMRPWERLHSDDSLKVWYVFRNAGQPACDKQAAWKFASWEL